MLTSGLSGGLSRRLSDPLGGSIKRRGSSAPTYPTTDLIQAEIYPDGLTLSGANVTGWTAAVGVNLTPTGTVTQVANGVNFGASSGLTHTAIVIGANTPFTLVTAGYRATSTSTWTLGGTTNVSGNSYAGIAGNALYVLGDSGSPGAVGVSINTTGKQYFYVRRKSNGEMYYGGTGIADANIGGYTNYNSIVFTFNAVPRTLYDSYDATTANMSRFLYAGTNGDIVTSGAMPDLVSYLVSKNGVAT